MRYLKHFGLPRTVKYLVLDRPGATGFLELTWEGYPAPFRLRRGGTDLRTFVHVIAGEGYQLPWDLKSEPRWIIDAGANCGLSAVYFAKTYPTATVIAIEPDEENFRLLVHNTASYDNIVCVKAALWPRSGSINLVDPGVGAWGYRAADSTDPGAEDAAEPGGPNTEASLPSTEIAAVTVEELIADHGIDEIGILKVDIEGGEHAVFGSADGWIDRVETIAIELHDRFQPGCTEVFEAATAEFTRRVERSEDLFVGR
ncbi:MAG: FkbM family methyltransferase [Microthrixaceae bacterium]|nr:FkbM family methyltransferase [Microthrixaceae bacterium]MCO5313738.1 FkbM family methyltransferase [Microthrixaceae bacterium]